MKLSHILENLERKIGPITKKFEHRPSNREGKPHKGLDERQVARLAKMLGATDFEGIIRNANKLDPTGTKAVYTYWIVRALSNSSLRLPEDAERITGTLELFDKVKKSKRFQDEKDVNQYKTFRDLEQVVSKYQQLEAEDKPTSVRQWEKWIEKQGMSLFYKDDMFTVLKFKLTGEEEEVAPLKTKGSILQNWFPTWTMDDETIAELMASSQQKPQSVDTGAIAVSKVSLGTSWCVGNPVTAESYLQTSPLYAIFRRGENYMLVTETWSEVMNTADMRLEKANIHSSLFFAKYLINKQTELPSHAKEVIKRYINPELEKYRPKFYAAVMAIGR